MNAQDTDHLGRPLVAITGIGLSTSIGRDVPSSWDALTSGVSGVRPITRFPVDHLRTRIAGLMDDLRQDDDTVVDLTLRAGLAAAREAVAGSGLGETGDFPGPLFAALPPNEMEWPARRRLYDAGPAIDDPNGYRRLVESARVANDPAASQRTLLGFVAEHLADALGTRGAPISLTTACASGTSAIQLAVEAIRRGDTDAAISLGADCSVTAEAMVRFALLSALTSSNDDPQAASRPFSKDRDGFVIAEGAAALVLENYAAAKARGAPVLAIVRGVAEKADNFHRTRSSPDGGAIVGVIDGAIRDAGLEPVDIDYVNAHGTSTPENDRMEARSLATVFGDALKTTPISSNKSMIGHTLTAAGAIEAVFSVKTIQDGVLPPTINYRVPDPDIELDVVPNEARKASVSTVLSNSFGFGGQNACLVLSAPV